MVLWPHAEALQRASGGEALTGLGGLSARIADLPSWLIGLIIALGGAGLAWLYYEGPFEWYYLAAFVVLVGLLLFLAWDGRHRLPEDPKAAVDIFGFRTLATVLLAALGAALVIVIAVEIVAPDPSNPDVEELFGALSAALAAALAASLVDVADKIDGPAAGRAEKAFKAAYRGEFQSGSQGHLAVFSNIEGGREGWAHHVRKERAQLVDEAWKEKKRGGGGTQAAEPPAGG